MQTFTYFHWIMMFYTCIVAFLVTPVNSLLTRPNARGCNQEYDESTCTFNAYCLDEVSPVDFRIPRYNPVCIITDHYGEEDERFQINLIYSESAHNDESGIPYSTTREPVEVESIISLDISQNHYKNFPVLKHMPRLTKLNMSKNDLTTAKLSNKYTLDMLTEIDFSYNTINSIEVAQGEHSFRTLKKFNISHNYLVEIPDALFEPFRELEELDLSHNFIDTLNILTFEGIKQVINLYLSHNRISDVNKSFFRFTQLKVLDLSNNQIKNIYAQDFENLSKLNRLDLSFNEILNIEMNAFNKMYELNILDLRSNRLESLSKESLSNAINLISIDLSTNKLKSLPNGLFKNKRVSNFSIAENILEGSLVRGTFEGLTFVTELDLSNQHITDVGDLAFFGLESVETLLLNNNSIRTLSNDSFKTLQRLTLLDLSNNEIVSIEFYKEDFVRLNSLLLRNNRLSLIKSENFHGLNTLQYLDLSNNNISKLEYDSFESLRDLINLEISHNPLSGVIQENTFSGLNSLPNLDISGSLLTGIKNNSFNGMEQLKIFNVSHGQIGDLEYNSLLHIHNVEIIDLSYNQLREFVINVSDIVNTRDILLNNNLIKVITSNSFRGLSQLNKVILSHNNIKTVENEAFNDQNDLSYLDLSYNTDLKLNVSIFKNNHNMKNLFLSGIRANIDFTDLTGMTVSELIISHSGITNITALQLGKLKHLLNLVSSNNDINRLEVGAFNNLSSLTELDLSFNKINNIQPGVFKDNTVLALLNISHNSLTTLSYGIFRGLIYLHTLDLSFNKLSSLESERFHGLTNLNELIVDHNNIESIHINAPYISMYIYKLSIGDNPLSCDVLVHLKRSSSMQITAINLDEHSNENIDGVTCNMASKSVSKIKTNTSTDETEVLNDIKDILLNISNNKLNVHDQQVNTNNTQLLTNITDRLEQSHVEYNAKMSDLTNLTSKMTNLTSKMTNMTSKIADGSNSTNIMLGNILKVLMSMNSFKRVTSLPTVKESSDDFIAYINKIKNDMQENMAEEKQKFDDIDKKISMIDSKVVTNSPVSEKLSGNNEDDKKSLMFIEICVALILLILVCHVLYKFYKSRMLVPNRRTSSTRQLPGSMDSNF